MGILGQQQGSPHLEIDLGAQPAPGDLTREEKPSPYSCLPPLRLGLSNGRTRWEAGSQAEACCCRLSPGSAETGREWVWGAGKPHTFGPRWGGWGATQT